MLHQDYIEKLLGLEGVELIKLEEKERTLHVYLQLPQKQKRIPSYPPTKGEQTASQPLSSTS